MSEKNRIEKVIQFQNMTSGQFAAEIGVQNSTLSHILNNRNNPSLDVLKKILSRFPEISTDWLILGQGSMLRQEKQSKEPTLFDLMDENPSSTATLFTNQAPKTPLAEEVIQNEMLNTNSALPPERPLQPARDHLPSAIHPIPSVELHHSFEKPHPAIGSGDEPSRTPPIPARKVTKVILYFTDNTFQEFESK